MYTSIMTQLPIHLTSQAVQFLYAEATRIVAHDFVGYLTRYSKRSNIGIGVTLFGKVYIFSTKGKPIPPRKQEKIFKGLIKRGFLEYDVDPFPEFSETHNLKFNVLEAYLIEGNCFEAQ